MAFIEFNNVPIVLAYSITYCLRVCRCNLFLLQESVPHIRKFTNTLRLCNALSNRRCWSKWTDNRTSYVFACRTTDFPFLVKITSVKLCGVCLFIPGNIQAAGGGLVKAGFTTSSLPFPGNEPFSCFISDATLSRSIMFDLSEGNKFRGPTATLDDAAPDVVS